MEDLTRMKKVGFILTVIFFVFLHIYLGLASIRSLSPTYDEPVHLTAGYIYWKTADFRYDGINHPPFAEMWPATPLLFLKPFLPRHHPIWIAQRWDPVSKWTFADRFLYRNRVHHEKSIEFGRIMQLVLSIFLGLALGLLGYFRGGTWCGLLAMAFWSVSPTFLAHGTLITTDFAFALFFFLFFASLFSFKSWKGRVGSGVLLGLCFASKYFAVAVGPALIGLFLWTKAWDLKEKHKDKKHRVRLNKDLVKTAALVSLVALAIVFVVYRGSGIEFFWNGLSGILFKSFKGHPSFFLGKYRTEGWLLYYPFVFLIKTPIPLLLGLLMALLMVIRKRLSIPPHYWIPPVIFFLLACTSNIQIGHRYILALYPFIVLVVAMALAKGAPWQKVLGVGLFGWMLLGTWSVKPYYLSYFNEVIGGPSQGYKYLTDSNVDWGQGLKALKEELDEEDLKQGIFLSYFGVADPHAYGIPYINVWSDYITNRDDDRGKPGIEPKKLALSVTNLQATYHLQKEAFSWLREIKPEKMIAYSIFLYDFHDQPEKLRKLMEVGEEIKL